jgi:hypothetical protein
VGICAQVMHYPSASIGRSVVAYNECDGHCRGTPSRAHLADGWAAFCIDTEDHGGDTHLGNSLFASIAGAPFTPYTDPCSKPAQQVPIVNTTLSRTLCYVCLVPE